jgi:hypothetical protein
MFHHRLESQAPSNPSVASSNALSPEWCLILRNRPDVVAQWEDAEVARRWLMICPPARCKGKAAPPTEAEIQSICRCPIKLAEIRRRLGDISWWVRLLNQRVAQRANREEEESGRFWQDRYRAIRLLDEEALISCMAYVDLNPLRAGMTDRIENSEHTSIKRRIECSHPKPRQTANESRDACLARLTLDETNAPIGPAVSESGSRCSDKGVLPMSLNDYLELLDWTARQVIPGKRGATPPNMPPVLRRLGIGLESWAELVEGFDKTFHLVAGRCDQIEAVRGHQTHRRFRVRPQARKLLPSAA